MTDKQIKAGARNAIRACMNVQPEDRVFILTDDDTLSIGEALKEEVKEVGAAVEMKRMEEYAIRPITDVPEELVKTVDEFKPTVTFFAASSQEGELAFRMKLSLSLAKHQVRHGHMVGITEQMMREGLRADYDQIYNFTIRVYELLKTAKTIHVTSIKGTDITATFSPDLNWVPSHGRYHTPGTWGNLPEGEVFTSPATVDGVIVADTLGDYFQKYGLLKNPMTFEIKDTHIEKISCADKEIEAEVWEYVNSTENGRRVGEYAIGTNTAVKKLIGNMLQDEKMPGLHIAFGNPYPQQTGAQWSSKVHMDVVPEKCTIQVDGKTIMVDGEFIDLDSL